MPPTNIADCCDVSIIWRTFPWLIIKLERVSTIARNSFYISRLNCFFAFKTVNTAVEITVNLSVFACVITFFYIRNKLLADITSYCKITSVGSSLSWNCCEDQFISLITCKTNVDLLNLILGLWLRFLTLKAVYTAVKTTGCIGLLASIVAIPNIHTCFT